MNPGMSDVMKELLEKRKIVKTDNIKNLEYFLLCRGRLEEDREDYSRE